MIDHWKVKSISRDESDRTHFTDDQYVEKSNEIDPHRMMKKTVPLATIRRIWKNQLKKRKLWNFYSRVRKPKVQKTESGSESSLLTFPREEKVPETPSENPLSLLCEDVGCDRFTVSSYLSLGLESVTYRP